MTAQVALMGDHEGAGIDPWPAEGPEPPANGRAVAEEEALGRGHRPAHGFHEGQRSPETSRRALCSILPLRR